MEIKKRRVLLLCTRHLLGESLENLLRNLDDVTLIGPWVIDARVVARISTDKPDIIVIVEEADQLEKVSALTAKILESCPDISILHSSLNRNVVRIYTSRELPARSADLIEAIRSLPE